MARILHLDTSAAKTIILLSDNGEVVHALSHEGARDGASVINGLIENALEAVSWSMLSLSAIAVCTGPGSYTGLRIALATAKGFGYALGIPLISHGRLELALSYMRRAAPGCSVHIAIIPARSGEYFIAASENGNVILAPQLRTTSETFAFLVHYKAEPTAVWGTYEQDIAKEIIVSNRLPFVYPDEATWANEAYNAFENNSFADAALLEPDYLKAVFILPPVVHKGI